MAYQWCAVGYGGIELDRPQKVALGIRPRPVEHRPHAPSARVRLGEPGVDLECVLHCPCCTGHHVRRRHGAVGAERDVRVGQPGICHAVAWVPLDGIFEALDALLELVFGPLVPVITTFEIGRVGVEIARVRRDERDSRRQLALECLDDRRGDLVLHGEHVLHVAIEAFGPEMIAVPGVDQFDRDPQPVVVLSHASVQDGRDIERATDLADVACLPLELKRRRARSDP